MKSGAWRQRERLWKENPHCHWCGQLTILLPQEVWLRNAKGSKRERRIRIPDLAATIDHIYSKWDVRRSRSLMPGERRHVLACFRCNVNRGRADQQANKALDQLRSHSWPIGKATILLAEAVFDAVLHGKRQIVIRENCTNG